MHYTTNISSSIGVDVSRSYFIPVDDDLEVKFIIGNSVDGIDSGEGHRLDRGLEIEIEKSRAIEHIVLKSIVVHLQ